MIMARTSRAEPICFADSIRGQARFTMRSTKRPVCSSGGWNTIRGGRRFRRKSVAPVVRGEQTELAFLTPPGARPKSRFMNLEPLLRWATQVLSILAAPPDVVLKHSTPERLAEKLGWLEEYRDAVGEWASWQAVVDLVVKFVNLHGHFADAAATLTKTCGRRLRRRSYPTAERRRQVAVGASPL